MGIVEMLALGEGMVLDLVDSNNFHLRVKLYLRLNKLRCIILNNRNNLIIVPNNVFLYRTYLVYLHLVPNLQGIEKIVQAL